MGLDSVSRDACLVYANIVCKNARFCSLRTSLWRKSPYNIYVAHMRRTYVGTGCIRNAINAKYVLTVKEDGFGKICHGTLFFITKMLIKIVAYVNVLEMHEEKLLLSDAMKYLCLKQGQPVFENFTNYLIARQSTPISGYSVCTIKRCASQMRAMAREVFILRGVCNVIKRMGKRRQRVFRRCGKPPERMKVDRHEAHDFETAIVLAFRNLFPTFISVVFNRDDRFVERLHRTCSREAAFQRQETKSEVTRVCSELNGKSQNCFSIEDVEALSARSATFAKVLKDSGSRALHTKEPHYIPTLLLVFGETDYAGVNRTIGSMLCAT
ncbi:hypothetical protein ALC53_07837 [Atta colombica]|uniref:Uncharacterized protein n=1 Tax=Atta colombica TaxID=520822 RepID=A0A195BBU2_9HYME|nr:hypothetical protein ALC53_07837 [Atta colombica]